MANVSEQQDNWSVFINGINSLAQTASSIRQSQIVDKELAFKERMANLEYSQKASDTGTQQLQASTNFLNAVGRLGVPGLNQEVLSKMSNGLINNFNPLTVEQRAAQAKMDLEELKFQNKLGEIETKKEATLTTQEQKISSINQNAQAAIGAKLAVAGVGPSEAARGARSAQEVFIKPEEIVKPIENLLSLPKFKFKIGEKEVTFGNKNLSSDDFINSINSKNLTEPYDNAGNTMLSDIQSAAIFMNKYPKKQADIVRGLISKHPELKDLLTQ